MIENQNYSDQNKTKQNKSNIIKVIIGILIVVIITIIIAVVTKHKNSDYSQLEEIAAKKYFENGFISVNELYIKAGKSDVDEVQTMQVSLKKALDEYFATTSETTVSAETILSMMENPYGLRVDFNGLVVSGYRYSPVDETFTKEDGAYRNMAVTEGLIESRIYENDNKKIMVQRIEKTGDNTYKVTADIGADETIVEDKVEMIVKLNGEEIALESVNIFDK